MNIIVICAAVAAVSAIIVIAPVVARQARVSTKSPVSKAVRAKHERDLRDYSVALDAWKSRHDLGRAKGMLKDLVYKRGMEWAVFDLAALCADEHSDKEALEFYRVAFRKPHPWHSSEETNPGTLGAYVDLARSLGAQADVQWGEREILKNYRPLGDAPDLVSDSNDPATLHAYACAARALMTRGEHENGIAMVEEADKTKPDDAAIQWTTGMVLFDANRAPEAKRHLLEAKRIGGLGKRQTRMLDLCLVQLHGIKPAQSDEPQAKAGKSLAKQM